MAKKGEITKTKSKPRSNVAGINFGPDDLHTLLIVREMVRGMDKVETLDKIDVLANLILDDLIKKSG